LLEYFAECGAILDDAQKRIVKEARRKNPKGKSVLIETKATSSHSRKKSKSTTKSNGRKSGKSKKDN
jgi:hypothetical protein